MASALVVGYVCRDRADLHISEDLVKELGQHRYVTDVAAGDLDGPDFQRSVMKADVDLAPQAALRATMLAGVSFSFDLRLDAGSVD